MMRKLLAWPFEFVHLVGTAIFFTLGVLMTLINAAAGGGPAWIARVSKLSLTDAADRYVAVSTAVGPKAMWLAAAALIGAMVAPYARGDGKKSLAWARVACAAVTLVLVAMVWGGFGTDWTGRPGLATKANATVTPWQVLALVGAIDLALVAFAIAGGAAKKAKAEGGDKK